jgi:hypothetical protein
MTDFIAIDTIHDDDLTDEALDRTDGVKSSVCPCGCRLDRS